MKVIEAPSIAQLAKAYDSGFQCMDFDENPFQPGTEESQQFNAGVLDREDRINEHEKEMGS